MNASAFRSLLCCPGCRGDLEFRDAAQEFFCPACRFTFPIIDGIPVLLPYNVKDRLDDLFYRHWDPEPMAEMYDTVVEGGGDAFGIYNHHSEVYGLAHYYQPSSLDLILDAGCGNGRFFETFPEYSIKIGVDASLNLLRRAKRRGRGDFLVCGELEHLPFKDATFGTVISCRVLQHLRQQEDAVREMARVTRDKGDVILELYNTWNLKALYKQVRMTRNLRKLLNAPFRLLFRSMSPFGDWGLEYDRYNGWFQVKRWMRRAHLYGFAGRGLGFGYHHYLLQPFYLDAVWEKKAPHLRKRYYDACLHVERAIGRIVPFRYGMEKFVIKASKNVREGEHPFAARLADTRR
jgi:SAM-dependent methyltransferase